MKSLYVLIVASLFALALTGKAPAQVSITVWQVDLQHSGNNSHESILTPGNVGAQGSFGLLFSQPMDGQTYGQPLIASGVNVGGTTHNIVYVCTEHCSIYAFDGDSNTGANANPIWHDNLLPAGTVPVPQSVVNSGDISVELGITTTPVIDMSTNTIYIVSKVQRTSDTTYHHYLYALDLATGATKFNSPVEINTTFPGSSSDSVGGQVPFNALREHSRSAMTLHNGVVYVSFASHSDSQPYHGEVIGFDKTTLQIVKKFNAAPNGNEAGIWQSGAGPAFDSAGNMFLAIANGSFDQNSPQNGTDWGESILKIDTSGTGSLGLNLYSNPLNWFTPNIWNSLNGGDLDLGSGGLCLLPDQAGPHTRIMVGGGKGAVLYVVDRDNLGGIHTPDNAIQEIPEVDRDWLFVTPAYFNGYIYYSPSGGPLEQRAVGYNPVDGSYISTTPITSTDTFNGKGRGCFISSSGTTNGVVWILTGGGVRAYDATNVSGSPIYSANSTLPGNIGTQNTKFSLPMVANGKLYYTAYDNTNTGHLLVSGLIVTGTSKPILPTNALAATNSSRTITVTWTDNSTNEAGFVVKRGAAPGGPFTQVGSVGANVTTFTDTGLTPSTTYYYQVTAFNVNGNSAPSNVPSATTFPYYYENGLVAYWNLDETDGNTVNDVTVNGHTGTINGEAGLLAGLINNGVEFHGTGQATSNITVANKADMQFATNQSFTLSAWVNPGALRGSEETIIAKSADQGSAYGIWINAANKWVFRGPGGDIVGPAVTEGAWTHVAAVQDGAAGTRKFYINGTLANSGAAQAADGAGDFWMAQQNVTGNLESFPGTIDEVRLYNRALAAGEIPTLMSPPVLAAVSVQAQGTSGTYSKLIWPSQIPQVEGRKGSPPGQYKLVLNFPAPVSGITASLGLQGGGSATGSVSSVTYDATNMVVTVLLSGVGNSQALDLHLSGISPGGGTADIPFNVLWGDVNGDGVVNSLDLSIVQNSHAAAASGATAFSDINSDGIIDSSDDSLVSGAIGTSLGSPTDTNLALFQPATASSALGANTPAMAFDSNTATRWESSHGVDPGWIYVDLGSVCAIHGVVLNWAAAGQNYTIDVCSGDPSVPGNWSTIQSVVNNSSAGIHTYSGLNASGRYVRMNGTAEISGSGYSLYDFQVLGVPGPGSASTPAITSALSASGIVSLAFNYQITASHSPTSFNASGLPSGLGVNTSTGVISGSPTATGTTNAVISAANTNGTGSAILTIVSSPPGPPPAITSGSLAAGTAGVAFNYQITASNSPSSFNATGLPAGLGVNTSTGLISGTTAAGTTSATISASNLFGTGAATLALVIGSVADTNLAPGGTLSASTVQGGNDIAFAADGNLTTRWAAGDATYPQWWMVDLGSNKTITHVDIKWFNTASRAYKYKIELSTDNSSFITAVDKTGNTTFSDTSDPVNASARYVRITITGCTAGGAFASAFEIQVFGQAGTPAPAIFSPLAVTGTNGAPLSYQIGATNSPTSYGASGLPSGLLVNSSTGIISGMPQVAGTINSPISATNPGGTGNAVLVFTIQPPPPVINSPLTAGGFVGAPFSYQIGATNNPASYGATGLPPGLGVNSSTGIISGTPSATGTTNSSITATNGGGTGSATLQVAIQTQPPPPVITSPLTVTGTKGVAFAYQIAATNSPASFGATGLPGGLGVNASTGMISGTPAAIGTSTMTVKAMNISGTGSAGVMVAVVDQSGVPTLAAWALASLALLLLFIGFGFLSRNRRAGG